MLIYMMYKVIKVSLLRLSSLQFYQYHANTQPLLHLLGLT